MWSLKLELASRAILNQTPTNMHILKQWYKLLFICSQKRTLKDIIFSKRPWSRNGGFAFPLIIKIVKYRKLFKVAHEVMNTRPKRELGRNTYVAIFQEKECQKISDDLEKQCKHNIKNNICLCEIIKHNMLMVTWKKIEREKSPDV